jgi:UDP-N-acetylglucosamine:LPS N-acetylglucosamine transferase
MQKTNVLILYIKAGHGHYGIANAIADGLASSFPGEFATFVEDVFLESDTTFQGMFQEFYSFLANYFPPVYSFGWYCSSFPPFHDFLLWLIKWRTKKRLQRIVNRVRPDAIVITHPVLQRVAKELTVHGGPRPELFHFIVDIEPLPWYFKYREYNILVSTPHLKEYACRHLGYRRDRVCVSPPPLRREFYEGYDEKAIQAFRKKYGFEDSRQIFLIFGGGNGLPKGEKIVFHLLNQKLDADIAIVCGYNDFQRRVVELMVTHFGDEQQKVHIFGFVEEIHELMAISDVVISKAGFSSIFEILALKKILIFSEFIWGQEKGNAMYLLRHRVGFYIKRPSKLARQAEALVRDRLLQDEVVANIGRLGLKNGTRETVDFIKRVLDARRCAARHPCNV